MSQSDYQDPAACVMAFNTREGFAPVPDAHHLTLTLITHGTATLRFNGKTAALISPCLLMSSWYDEIVLSDSDRLAAKSFSFHPALINKSLTFENLAGNGFDDIADRHDHSLLDPFLTRGGSRGVTLTPPPQTFSRISEWFDQVRREYESKTDENWAHRVRRCLMQILLTLEETRENDANALSDESAVDIVLEHIHANYSQAISLDSLCKLVYVNRTSLTRKFKARTRRPPIDYLLHHRLNAACELLTHSRLSVGKIAEATGFTYESYFTRQFTAKIGITPTQYRQSDGFEALNTRESNIVDEF